MYTCIYLHKKGTRSIKKKLIKYYLVGKEDSTENECSLYTQS